MSQQEGWPGLASSLLQEGGREGTEGEAGRGGEGRGEAKKEGGREEWKREEGEDHEEMEKEGQVTRGKGKKKETLS